LKSYDPKNLKIPKLGFNLISYDEYKNGKKEEEDENIGQRGIELGEDMMKKMDKLKNYLDSDLGMENRFCEADDRIEKYLAALELNWKREEEKNCLLLDLSKKRINEKDRRLNELDQRLKTATELNRELQTGIEILKLKEKNALIDKNSEIKNHQENSSVLEEHDSEIEHLAEELRKSETRSRASKSEINSEIHQEKHRLKLEGPKEYFKAMIPKSPKTETKIHQSQTPKSLTKNQNFQDLQSLTKNQNLQNSSTEELYDENNNRKGPKITRRPK